MSNSNDLPEEMFSGSNTSDIFEATDVVWHSPETTERTVDTQSGFQVVVKQLDNRNSLYVKRRIGTPPSSSVTLTPDESLKLSKILNGMSVEDVPKPFSQLASGYRFAKFGSITNSSSTFKNILNVTTVSILLVGVLLGFIVQNFAFNERHAKPLPIETNASPAQIDYFAKKFVSELLDFNPASYRVSQVRAMASMTPDLVNSYWRDTSFPLSKEQLTTMPSNNNLHVINIKQNKLNNKATDVEVFANLTNSQTNKSNPVHLQLRVDQDPHNQLYIMELKDLSNVSLPK